MSSTMEKRLKKELANLVRDPPSGIVVDADRIAQNITEWIVTLEGASGTLYDGEQFQLQFKFSPKYPFDSPQVVFVGSNIPVHPHIYSNGHICLSILTEDWSPALSVQSICLSVISMLSSCKEKVCLSLLLDWLSLLLFYRNGLLMMPGISPVALKILKTLAGGTMVSL